MNRKLRRMAMFGKRFGTKRNESEVQPTAIEPDPRTKSSGHGKKTADKWNQ